MTRDQAIKQAIKRWGKRAIVRACQTLSSPEKRADAGERFRAAKDRIDAIDAEIKDRLAALDWYQSLTTERRMLRLAQNVAAAERCHYKFAVGRDTGIAFHVCGQGDTWEQAFAAADQGTSYARTKAEADGTTEAGRQSRETAVTEGRTSTADGADDV
jgi:hypothetical protein